MKVQKRLPVEPSLLILQGGAERGGGGQWWEEGSYFTQNNLNL